MCCTRDECLQSVWETAWTFSTTGGVPENKRRSRMFCNGMSLVASALTILFTIVFYVLVPWGKQTTSDYVTLNASDLRTELAFPAITICNNTPERPIWILNCTTTNGVACDRGGANPIRALQTPSVFPADTRLVNRSCFMINNPCFDGENVETDCAGGEGAGDATQNPNLITSSNTNHRITILTEVGASTGPNIPWLGAFYLLTPQTCFGDPFTCGGTRNDVVNLGIVEAGAFSALGLTIGVYKTINPSNRLFTYTQSLNSVHLDVTNPATAFWNPSEQRYANVSDVAWLEIRLQSRSVSVAVQQPLWTAASASEAVGAILGYFAGGHLLVSLLFWAMYLLCRCACYGGCKKEAAHSDPKWMGPELHVMYRSGGDFGANLPTASVEEAYKTGLTRDGKEKAQAQA